jgi:CheY-like chemotaxis protein
MRQAAQRGATLTRQLLTFSRTQQLKPEVVNIARQIGGMGELLQRSLRGDVDVRMEFDEDLWPVEVDPGELELMVINLAVNARDAMPKGGIVTLRAQNLPNLGDDGLSGDYVLLSIADTGTGMTPEVRKHLFEPFFTTKEVGRGSGLGLSQVHGFATQSGGTVRIDSELGRGTVVHVYLPRSAKPFPGEIRPEAARQDQVRQVQALPAGCILLVEDDDEVSAIVTDMLEQLGFEVTRAASASAALGALANNRKVDLVFSDVMMPGGMNGVELAREIRARRSDLPVLLTSGYAEAAKRSADAVGLRVLPKPYGLTELASAVRAAMTNQPQSHASAC